MVMTQTEHIIHQINKGNPGEIFLVSDFATDGNDAYISRILSKDMVSKGLLQKLANGIYFKPQATRFGVLKPSMYKVAEAIAKRDKAKIQPIGATALNMLGLSTQVPMKLVYITTGMPRTVKVGNQTINFRKAAPRHFAYQGKLIPQLVQAIRAIGEDNITSEQKGQIAELLRKYPETETIEHDLNLPHIWIKKLIAEIRNNIKHDE